MSASQLAWEKMLQQSAAAAPKKAKAPPPFAPSRGPPVPSPQQRPHQPPQRPPPHLQNGHAHQVPIGHAQRGRGGGGHFGGGGLRGVRGPPQAHRGGRGAGRGPAVTTPYPPSQTTADGPPQARAPHQPKQNPPSFPQRGRPPRGPQSHPPNGNLSGGGIALPPYGDLFGVSTGPEKEPDPPPVPVVPGGFPGPSARPGFGPFVPHRAPRPVHSVVSSRGIPIGGAFRAPPQQPHMMGPGGGIPIGFLPIGPVHNPLGAMARGGRGRGGGGGMRGGGRKRLEPSGGWGEEGVGMGPGTGGHMNVHMGGFRKAKMPRGEEKSMEFYCTTCDKSFRSQEKLDNHKIDQHVPCDEPGCSYSAPLEILALHALRHVKGNDDKVVLENPEEIEKWRLARKANFPTRAQNQRRGLAAVRAEERGQPVEKVKREKRPASAIERLIRFGMRSASGRIALNSPSDVAASSASASHHKRHLSLVHAQQQQELVQALQQQVSRDYFFNQQQQQQKQQHQHGPRQQEGGGGESQGGDADGGVQRGRGGKAPVLCTHFAAKRMCKYGSACKFSHDLPEGAPVLPGRGRGAPAGDGGEGDGKAKPRLPLLWQLLAPDVKRWESLFLQAVRYFVRTNFLEQPIPGEGASSSSSSSAVAVAAAATVEDGDEGGKGPEAAAAVSGIGHAPEGGGGQTGGVDSAAAAWLSAHDLDVHPDEVFEIEEEDSDSDEAVESDLE
uniref:C3H1-type domain-containing protein n=1 Tax=Chromera velia CCMP2878 TaxID=1169474 RepID=A0A0G4FMF1_9ALVE|eukprot:Cvel_17774.t1-p1 / transcript=Cvel_17774.t1 / gene=Cvel_17774 / organism=Chromera_velia_CCMP2878 / gene_product=Nuclear fragile X mental retardation-interacting, putative / transcript_product=Nuclear fragile X mental retardation-interacting, putative / location=Cvel_scaffold1437:10816-17420(-) / protein_length=721 / sequence_SO=supercontig / SO=protein_coding / is_pseudo=false